MTSLEYRLGGIDINVNLLSETTQSSSYPNHKFVTEILGNIVSLYVAHIDGNHLSSRYRFKHKDVVDKWNLDSNNIVGGGSLYIHKGELVLDDYSFDYYAIPKEVALIFGDMISLELEKLGIKTTGVVVNPEEVFKRFWYDHSLSKVFTRG